MRQAMRSTRTLAAGAFLAILLLAAPASAQDGYRAQVQAPVPMKILPKPAPADKAAQEAPAQQQEAPAQGKFPNKDTAKNRQDIEFGTDTPGITFGRDEKTGDTTFGHTPQKKAPQPAPDSGMDITVKPVVRGGKY